MPFKFIFLYTLLLSSAALGTENYLIIGAGPAGLSAAIELAQKGVKNIVVIEKRDLTDSDYLKLLLLKQNLDDQLIRLRPVNKNQKPWGSRKRIIAFDKRALEQMKQLGVSFNYNPIYGMHVHSESMKSLFLSFSGMSGFGLKTYLGRDFTAALKISDLERGLLAKALSHPEISFIFGGHSKINLLRDRVLITNTENGEEEAITYKNLIIASGVGEVLKGQFTQPLTLEKQHWVVGNFYSDPALRPLNERGYHLTNDTHLAGDKIFQLALDSGADYVTVYASDNKPIENEEEVLKAVAKKLGVKGELKNGYRKFISQPAKSKSLYSDVKTSRGGQVLLIGDALFNHDPTTGAGTAIALRNSKLIASSIDQNGEINIQKYNKLLRKIEKEWIFLSKRFSRIKKHLKKLGPLFHKMSFFISTEPKAVEPITLNREEGDDNSINNVASIKNLLSCQLILSY